MAATGFLTVRVYESNAQVPVVGACVSVTDESGKAPRLIATRITNESGIVPSIPIATPDKSESLSPGDPTPYTKVNILVDYPDFERTLLENVQIFPGIITEQEVMLLPFDDQPDAWNTTEVIDVTAQEL